MGTTAVSEVMITKIVTVGETEKMEFAAKKLNEHDINAAPVIGRCGRCIGIITSHDIVEYESVRSEFIKEIGKGQTFCLGLFGSEGVNRLPGRHYDEVGFHMSTTLHTAEADDPLSRVARNMCRHHMHHVIVLDRDDRPVGMLSSLDVLGFVIGEPVCRSAICSDENERNTA